MVIIKNFVNLAEILTMDRAKSVREEIMVEFLEYF